MCGFKKAVLPKPINYLNIFWQYDNFAYIKYDVCTLEGYTVFWLTQNWKVNVEYVSYKSE